MTSLHADEAFLDHYHFTHDPFAARVPGFKFFPAQRKPVLGQLHHLARYSQLLLVVTGPHGSGKTLLRQALVASTNKQTVQSVVVSAKGASDPASIVRQIAQGLQVARPDASSVLAQVGQLALTGQEVYLLVDDAEDLSDAALSMLLELAAGNGEGRPHVFLFAEPDLIPRLDQASGGEESFHAIELQPYEEAETREYMAQRLDGAGQGIELFSDEQISDIHEQSGGWPGLINQIARETLSDAMVAKRGAAAGGSSFKLPRKHLLALAVVGVAVVAAWLMQGRQASSPEVAQQPSATAPVTEQGSTAPSIQFEGASQPLPLPLVGEAQPVIREPLAQASGMGEGDPQETANLPPAVPNVSQPVPVTAPTPAPEPTTAKPVEPVKPAPVVAQQPKPAPAPTPAPAPKPAPAPQPAKPVAATPSSSAGNIGWYGAQPGHQYVLQVFVTGSESKAQDFLRKNGAEFHYYKKMHQGSALFVVTYGKFSSQAAAKAAVSKLSPELQAGKPWARSIASIKTEAVSGR